MAANCPILQPFGTECRLRITSGREGEIELMRSVCVQYPRLYLVVLAGELHPDQLSRALGAGAHGYLTKDIACEALVQSLRLVSMGETVYSTHLAALLVSGRTEESGAEVPACRKELSQREVQILRCLLNGDSNKLIASHLGLTEATVKLHVKSLLRKIGASNRTQAAIWALNNGMGDQLGATNATRLNEAITLRGAVTPIPPRR